MLAILPLKKGTQLKKGIDVPNCWAHHSAPSKQQSLGMSIDSNKVIFQMNAATKTGGKQFNQLHPPTKIPYLLTIVINILLVY